MLLDDLYTYLSGQGVFDGSTWYCYKGYLPSSPDRVIQLAESGGLSIDTHGGENTLPTFQALVRGQRLKYEAARTKWQAVFNALNGSESALGYAMVWAEASAPNVFYDENERPILTVSFRVIKGA